MQQVLPIKRSIRSVIPSLIAAGVLYQVHLSVSGLSATAPTFGLLEEPTLELPLVLLLVLFLIARPVILLFDERAELSTHHLRAEKGRFSLRRKNTVLAIEDLRGVTSKQTIVERILNIGTIIAWTHSEATPEIFLVRIGSPDKVVKTIAERIDQAWINKKAKQVEGEKA